MEEKKHVGRPTNEEVASRKKKKVVKYSLITIVSILLLGGVTLFFNRDKLDFSSMMGLSIFKTYKYVVNYSVTNYKGEKEGFYHQFLDTSNLNNEGYTKCRVSSSRYANCEVFGDELRVYAKKKGNVNIKVYGINKKGKTVSKTIRIKIGKDFTSPICSIVSSSKKVKRGSNVTATISCNENISLNTKANDVLYVLFYYNSVIEGSCKTDTWSSEYLTSIDRINNKSYKVSFNIPKNACITNDFVVSVSPRAFIDSYNNINYNDFSTSIKITR